MFDQVLQREPANKSALTGAAKCADLQQDHVRSCALYEAAKMAHPGDPTIATRLGRQQRILGQLSASVFTLREVIRDHPSNAAAARELARALVSQAQQVTSDDPEAALVLYREASDLWPSTEAVDMRIGRLLARLERNSDGVTHLRGALTRHGEGPDLVAALAAALQTDGQHAEAIAWWGHILAEHPADRRALVQAAACSDAMGDADRELALLRSAAAHYPDDAFILVRLGRRLRRSSLLAEAEATLRRAEAVDPSGVAARIEMARALREGARVVEALQAWEQVLTLAPQNPTALSGYASCAQVLGKHEEALARFRQLAALKPDDVAIQVHIGRQQRLLDRLSDAHDTLKGAIAADPTLAPAAQELARLHHALGNFEESVRWWRRAIDLEPGGSPSRVAAARLLGLLGRHGEALRAFDGGPHDPSSVDRRVRVLVEIGRFDDADQVVASAAEADVVSPSTRDALRAIIAAARWDLQAAQVLLSAACSAEPTSIRLHHLAHIRIASCDPAGAMSALGARVALLAGQGRVPTSDRQMRATQGLLADIANEMLLDSASLEKSRLALAKDSLERAISTVRRHPGSQAASSTLLIVLRRLGRLSPRGLGDHQIPSTIVQAWFGGAAPPESASVTDTWTELNPGFQHIIFDDRTAVDYLADVAGDRATRAFRRARHPAAKADIFRLAYLATDGGVWADIDDRCVAPIEPAIAGRRLVAWQEQRGNLGNDVIAAAPGHPALLDAMEESFRNALDTYTETTWLATGPGLLSRAFTRWLALDLDAADLGTDTVVLDGHEIRRYVSPGQPLRYKAGTRGWQNAEALRV